MNEEKSPIEQGLTPRQRELLQKFDALTPESKAMLEYVADCFLAADKLAQQGGEETSL